MLCATASPILLFSFMYGRSRTFSVVVFLIPHSSVFFARLSFESKFVFSLHVYVFLVKVAVRIPISLFVSGVPRPVLNFSVIVTFSF